jgi:site-specific recombinase XerD
VSTSDELSVVYTLRNVTNVVVGVCRVQRLVLPGGERTWTVLGPGHRPVGPAEEYLEYLRVQRVSPNTVKSYARALALWWQYLELFALTWDSLTLEHIGGFLSWLRNGDSPEVTSIEPRSARFAESTVAARLRAVMSFYGYHQLNGVDLGRDLYRLVYSGGRGYKPLLEHVARRKGRRQAVIRVRDTGRGKIPPTLTPGQIGRIYEACAVWDANAGQWHGSVRDRLLWMVLAETGLRLGEALGLLHCDWHTGCGDTAFIEVVPRDHPHGVRVKNGGYRKLYVSDELDRLYGEYLWRLCDAGADDALADLDRAHVFVNLAREPRFSPLRPESVYDLVDRLRRQLAGQVPGSWTPHWLRHSHATALLLAGVPVHVVSRRLGHADVQTTLNTYAHVTEDADMRSVAEWRAFTAGWHAVSAAEPQIGPCS